MIFYQGFEWIAGTHPSHRSSDRIVTLTPVETSDLTIAHVSSLLHNALAWQIEKSRANYNFQFDFTSEICRFLIPNRSMSVISSDRL